jgi:protein ImuB
MAETWKKDQQATPEIRQVLEILHKWGIHTLGQFAELEKEDVRARLGAEGVRLWEKANGQSNRLLKFVQPPESFVESFEFEQEVETIVPLLFMLRRFLQQLALRLSTIYLVAKEITLRITFADPPQDGFAAANKKSYQRCFKIPQPTNDVDLLFRMLHTHLENFKSEQPIIAVSLDAKPIRPVQQQFGLFETALRDPHQLFETLARLIALLGSDRVGTPVVEETHRPDAFHVVKFEWFGGTTSEPPVRLGPSHYSSDARKGIPPSLRKISQPALRRFRPAIPASVLLDVDLPVHVRSAQISAAASAQRGPYVASGNWWDEKDWSRREWDLQLSVGAVLRCHQDKTAWHIDGIYD